jgi:hypothetical protein
MTRRQVLWTVSTILIVAFVAGCRGKGRKKKKAGRAPTPEQVAEMLEPNIIGVHAYTDAINCWVWNEDRTAARGIIIKALYLEGPNGGAFGDGIIQPKLFVSYWDNEGKRQWRLAKEWSYDVNEAIPFRTKKKFMAGWGYRLHLVWGDEVDLTGREVRLVVEFKRRDGIVVRSGKTDRKVPVRGT